LAHTSSYSIFLDGGHLHLGFLKFEILAIGTLRSNCINVPNFVTISQTVVEIWRFFDFSKMAAVRHLGFVMRTLGPSAKVI